jgi:hypothetical protein
MGEPMDLNSLSKLWKKFSSNALLCINTTTKHVPISLYISFNIHPTLSRTCLSHSKFGECWVKCIVNSWRWKNWLQFKVWDLRKMKKHSQHWHLWKENLEPTLQAFGFDALYVCTTFSYDDIFSLWWCHHNVD